MTPPMAEEAQRGLEIGSPEKITGKSAAKARARTPRASYRVIVAPEVGPKRTISRGVRPKMVNFDTSLEYPETNTKKLDFVQSEQKQEEKLAHKIKLAENEHLKVLLNLDENFASDKLDPAEEARFTPCNDPP